MSDGNNPPLKQLIDPSLFQDLPGLPALFGPPMDTVPTHPSLPEPEISSEPIQLTLTPVTAPYTPPPTPSSNPTVAVCDIPVPGHPVVLAPHLVNAPKPVSGKRLFSLFSFPPFFLYIFSLSLFFLVSLLLLLLLFYYYYFMFVYLFLFFFFLYIYSHSYPNPLTSFF
ncbi:hypothetical protein PPACK8108_LOCUS19977 [Phakopsora pachyrhizi]|uniref:Uncharacterized protein n=1 Tax=Phakopsora pachyrhizi TaxID=170000 RepID=A0AAV0BHB3_PHAPC|nr:hypothetical protein PPACK8108_LOCUS19977 [Phakopsora pachyrhizi]